MRSRASSQDNPATSVSHASASMPVALRIASASRCISASDISSTSGASASSIHLIARPCRSGSSRSLDRVGFEREAKHRALLRLGVDDHASEGVDDEIEAAWLRRRVRPRAGAKPRPSPDAPRPAVRVDSGSSDRRWRERSTPSPPPLRPWASRPPRTSWRAARDERVPGAALCPRRPLSSYGIDIVIMIPYSHNEIIRLSNGFEDTT